MAKELAEWLTDDVAPVKESSIRWLSEVYFHRDPYRATYVDSDLFFSPADGVLLYQRHVDAGESVLDQKGVKYSVRDILRDEDVNGSFLAIGIFLTFYDAHIQRLPYSGVLSYEEHEPLKTNNLPMLEVERWIVDALHLKPRSFDYLANNQRVVNTIYAPNLESYYHVVQLADYDVDCIVPFQLEQNLPMLQGARFGQIRYGSQVDLIIPMSDEYTLKTIWPDSYHVQAGIDPLVEICC